MKLAGLQDDTPVKPTIELPAQIYRDLVSYAQALAHAEGGKAVDPAKLAAPMLARFMATDRAFLRIRNSTACDS